MACRATGPRVRSSFRRSLRFAPTRQLSGSLRDPVLVGDQVPASSTARSGPANLAGLLELSQEGKSLRRIGIALLGDRTRAQPIDGLAEDPLELLCKQHLDLLASLAWLDLGAVGLSLLKLGRAVAQSLVCLLEPDDLGSQLLQAALYRLA